jgi:hypothetical protein
MKKQIFNKKLMLRKVTIVNLEKKEMQVVFAGGIPTEIPVTCPTRCCPNSLTLSYTECCM